MADLHGDIEALLAEAHRRAEQRALEREAAAARRAEEVLASANDAVRRTLDARRAQTLTETDAARERVLALGRMAAQRAMLVGREALLERVWDEARRRLQACAEDPERYLEALRRLARLASHALPPGDLELASDARGHALLTPDRLGAWSREDGVRYDAAAGPADIDGGLVARAGRLRFDGSFETRLQQARSVLREDVAARLASAAEPAARAGDGRAAP